MNLARSWTAAIITAVLGIPFVLMEISSLLPSRSGTMALESLETKGCGTRTRPIHAMRAVSQMP